MNAEIESAVYALHTGRRLFASPKADGRLPDTLDGLNAFYRQLKGAEAVPAVDIVENRDEKCLLICHRGEEALFVTKVNLERLKPLFTDLFDLFQYDRMTGALRKEYAVPHVATFLTDFARYGTPFALMFLDLDHFKSVNDHYGHLVGDEVLKGVAAQICGGLREGDHLIRYGGEEFLVLLKHAPLATVFKVAERLRERVAATPIQTARGPIICTVSIDLTTPQEDDTPLSIIERADRAVYQAKAKGRNRVEYL